ncbi:MAG: hypothetical protein KGO96_07040 [Elusimicrobia bacterium]|nr:hypothetical protein [Elusimicrobiota bacterium]
MIKLFCRLFGHKKPIKKMFCQICPRCNIVVKYSPVAKSIFKYD